VEITLTGESSQKISSLVSRLRNSVCEDLGPLQCLRVCLRRVGRRMLRLVAAAHVFLWWMFGTWFLLGLLPSVVILLVDNRSALGRFAPFIRANLLYIVLGILICASLLLASWLAKKRVVALENLHSAFRLVRWSEELRLSDLGFEQVDAGASLPEGSTKRPFYGVYVPRRIVRASFSLDPEEDDLSGYSEDDLTELVVHGSGLLLVDHEHSGKSLTVFRILRGLSRVLIVSPDDPQVPSREMLGALKGCQTIILMDNLGALARSKLNLELLVERVAASSQKPVRVVGTCRETDFPIVVSAEANYTTQICENLPRFSFVLMTVPEREILASSVGVDLPPEEMSRLPLPGDIALHGSTRVARERYGILPKRDQQVLRAIRLLDDLGITVTMRRIQVVLRGAFCYQDNVDSAVDSLTPLAQQTFFLALPTSQEIYPHMGALAQAFADGNDVELLVSHSTTVINGFSQDGDTEALICLGDALRRHAKHGTALTAIDSLLEIAPNDWRAHFHKGRILSEMGRVSEALESNSAALGLTADHVEIHIEQSRLLGSLGRVNESLHAAEVALNLRPHSESAIVLKAISLSRMGKHDEAEAVLNRAIALHPNSYDARIHLGITLGYLGSFEEAFRMHRRAVELRPDYAKAHRALGITLSRWGYNERALVELDRAIELDPSLSSLYVAKSHALMHMERRDEAMREVDTTLKQNPADVKALCQKAYILSGLNELDEALQLVDSALALTPENAHALYQRSSILARLSRHDEALIAVDAALKKYPRYKRALVQRCFVLGALRRYQELRETSEALLEISPDEVVAYIGMALALSGLGFYDQALNAVDTALEIDPGSTRALYIRAGILAGLGRLRDAEECIDTCLEDDPENASYHRERAFILDQQGRYGDAITALKKAEKQSAKNPEIKYQLGLTYFHAKQYALSLEAIRSALILNPSHVDALTLSGTVLGRMKRDHEALDSYNMALKLDPKHAGALFEKARTLCFVARGLAPELRSEILKQAIESLEEARNAEDEVLVWISRQESVFTVLSKSQEFGERFERLLWGRE